ncbi:hypothetical protein Pmani_028074 [Petrolisthes manimaculis]|uniref:Uncharacterized protein n=1 Tax=Petrolisthes manimaculis TaxID=1843537 RepID=A0AAE1P2T7_9EUCA|nr:hypothetical protein Pmani_028074 [Petrolisthes manimaculis]
MDSASDSDTRNELWKPDSLTSTIPTPHPNPLYLPTPVCLLYHPNLTPPIPHPNPLYIHLSAPSTTPIPHPNPLYLHLSASSTTPPTPTPLPPPP